MKKITELTELRFRTSYSRDEYGNRYSTQEEYLGIREIKSKSDKSRCICFLIDLAVVLAITLFTNLVFKSFFVVFVILHFLYYFISEYYYQKTIGKIITNAILIDIYANRPNLKNILIRTFGRLVPIDILSYMNISSGMAPDESINDSDMRLFGDNNCRGFHDIWSNTWVVSVDELRFLKQIQKEQEND